MENPTIATAIASGIKFSAREKSGTAGARSLRTRANSHSTSYPVCKYLRAEMLWQFHLKSSLPWWYLPDNRHIVAFKGYSVRDPGGQNNHNDLSRNGNGQLLLEVLVEDFDPVQKHGAHKAQEETGNVCLCDFTQYRMNALQEQKRATVQQDMHTYLIERKTTFVFCFFLSDSHKQQRGARRNAAFSLQVSTSAGRWRRARPLPW